MLLSVLPAITIAGCGDDASEEEQEQGQAFTVEAVEEDCPSISIWNPT